MSVNSAELRCNIAFEDVKKEVTAYLTVHKNACTCDVIFDLRIAPLLVVDALNMLEAEGLINGYETSLTSEEEATLELYLDADVFRSAILACESARTSPLLSLEQVFG